MFRGEAHGNLSGDFWSIMATTVHETVLIGVCDGAIDKKSTSYCTNKIGDIPVNKLLIFSYSKYIGNVIRIVSC